MLSFMTVVIVIAILFIIMGILFAVIDKDWDEIFICIGVATIALFITLPINFGILEEYKGDYPLNSSVQVTIDRKEMDDKFGELSDTEKSILELSKEQNDFCITRKEGNILVMTSKDSKEEFILMNEENDVKWVDYLLKDYFNCIKSE